VKIKLDEKLPQALVVALTDLGHDVDTAVHEGLATREDHAIWRASQDADRFLITQDPGRTALFDRVQSLFRTRVFDWTGCLVVASDRKLRVRHLMARSHES
jgi:predicted nuclease of predicted toxin-antitoxin system